jgi:separase
MVRDFVLFPDYLSSEAHLLGEEESVLSSIRETNKHVKDAMALSPPSEPEDDYTQAETKMRRALCRLKRVAIKFIDHPDDMKSLGDGIVRAVKTLLMDIATTMEALLSAVCTARASTSISHPFHHLVQESESDDYASLLDLFFVLARTTLAPNNPVLTDAAYDLLSRAARLLGFQLADNFEWPHTISPLPSVAGDAFANFVRCLSGAFHTLGGTFYQAGKYGTAIRFLRRGCFVGGVALRLREGCDTTGLPGNTQEPQKVAGSKESEGWGQLRDQLSRRWELLGVCYSKIGDRQVGQSLSLPCGTATEPLHSIGCLRSFH